ncbi:hypothetical protein CXG81DRAFT_12927 [Caulochytrium protostelioides]|uniref:DUF866-domain-containing protein n=1 Tax=Caulochytrium protostelioides TaxID=1555241 RepID=A0A4P9X696_9FUNG|nr:DUF866-domain-containing protein [Caulochytrium protostelioides]RKP00672.1 hypothetical protein CXG81DRAFT_12927 [Caulochytrium protostelioides]|eukprot:RKP00672.1 hypothetical protein CXG81DRAFT_12927 [Caulochytrium protostelioides]
MPVFEVALSAELNHLTALRPQEPETEYEWAFQLECSQCREATEEVSFTTAHEEALPGSRGTAHFVMKCPFCANQFSASLVKNSVKAVDDTDRMTPIARFEWRGATPTAFVPRDRWVAQSTASATTFDAIPLSEKEFFEYDEEGGTDVSVSELRTEVTKV